MEGMWESFPYSLEEKEEKEETDSTTQEKIDDSKAQEKSDEEKTVIEQSIQDESTTKADEAANN